MIPLDIDPLEVFKWALSATGLLALIAAVVIYIKGAAREITIKMLEEGMAARDTRIHDLEGDMKTLKATNEGLEQKVHVLENVANSGDKIEALRGDVMALIQAMHDALGNHHTTAMEHIDIIHSDVAGLPLALAKAIREAT